MALHRVQIPSPNHSGNRPSSRLLVVHTSEGATTFRNLGNFLANPSSQVSYQVGFDDTTKSEIGEYVAHPLTPWAAMSANSWGQHGCCCTPSGASSGWSRQTWLSHDRMMQACGAWLGEEAARYGVPLVKIGPADISAGRAGVCGHGDCSAAGAGGSHTDPGPNFPWDVVLVYAGGAEAGAPEYFGNGAQEDSTVAIVTHPNGKRIDTVVVGVGQSIWHHWNHDGDPFHMLSEPLEGLGKAVSACWDSRGRFIVTVHGTDDKMWCNIHDGARWSGWAAVPEMLLWSG